MRSSQAIDAFANQKGFDYIHVLQPNQYLDDSKPFSAIEQEKFRGHNYYGDPIRNYYLRLDLRDVGIQRGLDLRNIFKGTRETLFRDECCHFSNRGMVYLAQAIIDSPRETFVNKRRSPLETSAS